LLSLFPQPFHRRGLLQDCRNALPSSYSPSANGRLLPPVGLRRGEYGAHSLRRTKASISHKQTGNLRAMQILRGHTKIENTVRYIGVDVEGPLALAEATEV
jgi:hypothetical protein